MHEESFSWSPSCNFVFFWKLVLQTLLLFRSWRNLVIRTIIEFSLMDIQVDCGCFGKTPLSPSLFCILTLSVSLQVLQTKRTDFLSFLLTMSDPTLQTKLDSRIICCWQVKLSISLGWLSVTLTTLRICLKRKAVVTFLVVVLYSINELVPATWPQWILIGLGSLGRSSLLSVATLKCG